jgi:PhnB protein
MLTGATSLDLSDSSPQWALSSRPDTTCGLDSAERRQRRVGPTDARGWPTTHVSLQCPQCRGCPKRRACVGWQPGPVPDCGVPGSGPRAGYRSITPRVVVDDVAAQVDFLREVFGGTGDVEPGRPAEVRIGDSVIMISSTAERDPFPALLYVYVDDADQTFQRAIAAGARVIEEPLDTPYGDRRAMVRDPFGNVLQIAHPGSKR